jgi:hypothetical protein
MQRLMLALTVLAALTSAADANDSTAELTTGGLIFVQNEDVEMRSEDLFISAREVRVDYRFFNKAARDVTVLVAFPMPEIRWENQETNIAVPTEDPVNLLDFQTRVNGAPVATKVEQRVTSLGIDRTALLRELHIPLAPHLRASRDALDKLPPEKWDELIRLGLAEIEEYDIGQGMRKHLGPRWTLHTTYYWEQTFPSRTETAIAHRYKPSVGGTAGTSVGVKHSESAPHMAEYRRKYCIDKELLASVERVRKSAKSEYPPFMEERIDYILKTGANWSGPIKDFRLVVDKGDADTLVSFCGEKVKKIGPTQFEMRKADYTPDGNFAMLFLKRMKER